MCDFKIHRSAKMQSGIRYLDVQIHLNIFPTEYSITSWGAIQIILCVLKRKSKGHKLPIS